MTVACVLQNTKLNVKKNCISNCAILILQYCIFIYMFFQTKKFETQGTQIKHHLPEENYKQKEEGHNPTHKQKEEVQNPTPQDHTENPQLQQVNELNDWLIA